MSSNGLKLLALGTYNAILTIVVLIHWLDGGGMKILSQASLLKEMMQRIGTDLRESGEADDKPEGWSPKPCEFFVSFTTRNSILY